MHSLLMKFNHNFYLFPPLILCMASQSFAAGPADLADEKYDQLREEFLNVNPELISVLDFSSVSSTDLASLANNETSHGYFFRERPPAGSRNGVFGAKHICEDTEKSLCWFHTGGSLDINAPQCGALTGDNYEEALSNTSLHCNPGSWNDWNGLTLFLNSTDNNDYVQDAFSGTETMPLNRVCVEIEFPVDLIRFDNDVYAERPELRQLVNPEIAHTNLADYTVTWGTYTAPKVNETEVNDEEAGGTFQKGGTHYYHDQNERIGQFPPHKAFAIDQSTIVTCIGPNPTNVRSGMRPAYVANPLYTLVGNDSEGITNAYSYINYLTRIYLQWHGGKAEAIHPLDIKLKKVWLMYEENEMMLLGGEDSKSVLSVNMIEKNGSAHYPVILLNSANETRFYRFFVNAGETVAIKSPVDQFKLYLDANKNRVLDNSESLEEVNPYSILELPANTSQRFIAVHSPDFDSGYQSKERYGRKFAQSTIAFIEVDRLRSTGHAFRTWVGTQEEVSNKDVILSTMSYPAVDSDYSVYAEFNENPTSTKLVRNSPDYINALNKAPKSPTLLRFGLIPTLVSPASMPSLKQ
ncbi:MAG: hypothetical protein ACJAS1_002081 [Oleiphilaceae bacterium]|jgi:hypothetical protein